MVAQGDFGHERELGQVGQRFQVIRVHTLGIKGGFVKRHVVIGVLQRPAQTLQLQGADLVTAGGFDGFEFAGLGHLGCHGVSFFVCNSGSG